MLCEFLTTEEPKSVSYGHPIITAYYILEKELGRETAKEKIGRLLQYIAIQPIYKEDLLAAITSKFKDFEGGAQYFCTLRH